VLGERVLAELVARLQAGDRTILSLPNAQGLPAVLRQWL